MAGWTEESLRSAASWKAFKEGKTLFETGSVVEVTRSPTGWKGLIQLGKRPLRVSVTAVSPTHLEVRCPCPENQSSGAVCCHAVATGLAALHGTRRAALPTPTTENAPPPPPGRAFRIHLPVNWMESLRRGRLAATVSLSKNRPPEAADQELEQWWIRNGTTFQDPLHLHLDAPRIAEFLQTTANHPEIWVGKTDTRVSVSQGARLMLRSSDISGQTIRLTPETPANSTWCAIGGTYWMATGESILRAGQSPMPALLERLFTRLAQGDAVDCPSRTLLENLIAWQEWIEVPTDDGLAELHFLPAHATFHLMLDGSIQEISAALTVAYSDHRPVTPGLDEVTSLPRVENSQCWVRDYPAEQSAVHTLQAIGFTASGPTGPWKLAGDEPVTQFIAHHFPALRESWTIQQSARFASLQQQVSVVSPQIQILGSGDDWLSFNLSFQSTDGSQHTLDDIRKMLRGGNSRNRGQSNKRLLIDEQAMNLIEPLLSELDLRQVDGHFEATKRSGAVIQEIRNYLHKEHEYNRLETFATFQKPATIHAEMRPYQALGSGWLLDRIQSYGGALLADDMGLGKTLQAIALIEHLFSAFPATDRLVLVVATTTLLGNWRAEFEKFAPGRKVVTLHGSNRDQQRERAQGGKVVLTSYGTLARDLAWHLKQDYLAIIVDEASLMRNPDTDHAKAVCKLRSPHRIALTGTPVENSVRDLWSLFRFVQPGWLGSREEFRDRYEIPLQAANTSNQIIMERLKLKTRPFLLRRTKEQVAPELPSKIVIDEFCELSAEQQAVYKDLLIEGRKRVESLNDRNNRGAARMQILTALLRLRQTCCDLALLTNDRLKQLPVAKRSGKVERLLEILEEALSNDHKVLVFSQFQQQLVELERSIQARGWSNLRLDGQTRNRQALVDRFQSDEGPSIFLISLKAGGYGLNLTAADVVVHFDPWWNPAAEAQATDRAHRIGQTRPVTVYRLLTRGTVEEKVVRLQARKRDLAASIDEAGGGDAPSWDIDDLASIIRD